MENNKKRLINQGVFVFKSGEDGSCTPFQTPCFTRLIKL